MKNNLLLSVAIATYNESANIGRCLDSIKNLSNDIVIVDGQSSDDTVKIAKQYPHVKVISTTNKPNFHINKQLAIDNCQHDWVLLLDADEAVSPQLSKEIISLLSLDPSRVKSVTDKLLDNHPLFKRHQQILESRDGQYGQKSTEYTAFFVPRLNYFLGKFIKYGGVYPDGQIRLFRKSVSRQPAKDVHEQISTDGLVGWLGCDLLHYADPTFSRYLLRNSRYTSNIATELQQQKLSLNSLSFFEYFIIKPTWWFLLTYFRHKGILDGFPGFVFSWYSSLRFPLAYVKYFELSKTNQTITVGKDWD
jgi:glycosyltransferase involved in cell wall biosynthesis